MPSPNYRVSSPPLKPLVLFDGECRFCRHWAGQWRANYGPHLDVAPGQDVHARFPEIPGTAFDEALQLVEPDGSVYSGAYAVLRARSHGRGRRGFLRWLYETVPGAASLMNFGYRIIARNRRVFSYFMS